MIAKENFARVFVIGSVAVLNAALISILAFVVLGLLVPMGMAWALHGQQAVCDAPAHGGAVFLLTIPLVGTLSLPALVFLAITFYRKLSERSKPSM
jgi:hypothetical protein